MRELASKKESERAREQESEELHTSGSWLIRSASPSLGGFVLIKKRNVEMVESEEMCRNRRKEMQRCPRSSTGPLTPGPRSSSRASLVCSFAALCVSTSRVLVRNPMGSDGVEKTTTLSAVRALPDNSR